jgi:hypothetical protein
MCFVPLLALILLGSVQVAPATQLPEQVRDRVQVFATCSGRFSAMAARARSFRDGDAREHERMRDTFDLLLEAILPDAPDLARVQLKQWTARGWSETGLLLAARDKRQRRAQVQLSRRLDGCRALLL